MKVYESKNIRNIALIGHAGAGKTSFAENMLFTAGAISRMGAVEDKNTVSDYHEIEQSKNSSVYSSQMYAEWKNLKYNIIDTPGYDDYIGESIAAIHVADMGIILINAQNGLEVGTELAWQNTLKTEKPVSFVINKLEFEQADFQSVVDEAKDQFGSNLTVIQYPLNEGLEFDSIVDILDQKLYKHSGGKVEITDIPDSEAETVKKKRDELMDSIAESDEDLMNKYFDEGELSREDMAEGLKNAIISRQIFPVFAASSKTNIGTQAVMQFLADNAPSPIDMPTPKAKDDVEVICDANGKIALFVYKMFSDPRLGDMVFFKVNSGSVAQGQDLLNSTRGSAERFGQIFAIQGKNRTDVTNLVAGDMGATVKLKNTHINDSLHEKGADVEFNPIVYPNGKVRVAIVSKTKGEEEKVGMGLHAIHLEDPSLIVEHSQELRQTIIYAQGELHLGATKYRLENRYKVETEFIEPRVPYRETIQKMVRGDYRHKKQSGGAGQFAEVHIQIEPWADGMAEPKDLNVRGKDIIELKWGGKLVYYNCIVGGVIDQRFLPAILKGVMEKMEFGPLTGSYVRDIRVSVYDGKMHPVDSNEAAFKMAGSQAFKNSFVTASPKLLEPVYNVTIKVPEDHVGDVMSDLPSRRGVILGIDADGRYQKINAKMPLAELDKYATALRSMTQARATFESEYDSYQAVPSNVQQELIDAYNTHQSEE